MGNQFGIGRVTSPAADSKPMSSRSTAPKVAGGSAGSRTATIRAHDAEVYFARFAYACAEEQTHIWLS
jgi:hypothetical protein